MHFSINFNNNFIQDVDVVEVVQNQYIVNIYNAIIFYEIINYNCFEE